MKPAAAFTTALPISLPGFWRKPWRNSPTGTAPRIPQDAALVSYIPKLERDDGRIDWNLPAAAIERRIRAYEPWPGTFTIAIEGGKEKRLKIFPPASMVELISPLEKFPAKAANSS